MFIKFVRFFLLLSSFKCAFCEDNREWLSKDECGHRNELTCFREVEYQNPNDDVNALVNMDDQDHILYRLSKRTEQQRLILVETYKNSGGDLIDKLQHYTSFAYMRGFYDTMITDLLSPISEMYAKVFTTTKKLAMNENHMVEIYGTLSYKGLSAVSDKIQKFSEKCMHEIIDLNEKKYGLPLRNLWMNLSRINRYDDEITTPYSIDKDVEDLKILRKSERGYDEPFLTELLTLRNFRHLEKVVKKYENNKVNKKSKLEETPEEPSPNFYGGQIKQAKKLDIKGVLKKTVNEELKRNLDQLLDIAKGRDYYFASVLNRELTSGKTNYNPTIWRIILGRLEVNLHGIMYHFKKINGESLEVVIEKMIEDGYYRKTLLNLIEFRKGGSNLEMDEKPEFDSRARKHSHSSSSSSSSEDNEHRAINPIFMMGDGGSFHEEGDFKKKKKHKNGSDSSSSSEKKHGSSEGGDTTMVIVPVITLEAAEDSSAVHEDPAPAPPAVEEPSHNVSSSMAAGGSNSGGGGGFHPQSEAVSASHGDQGSGACDNGSGGGGFDF